MLSDAQSDFIIRYYFKHREYMVENGLNRSNKFTVRRNALFEELTRKLGTLFNRPMTRAQIKSHWDNRKAKVIKKAKDHQTRLIMERGIIKRMGERDPLGAIRLQRIEEDPFDNDMDRELYNFMQENSIYSEEISRMKANSARGVHSDGIFFPVDASPSPSCSDGVSADDLLGSGLKRPYPFDDDIDEEKPSTIGEEEEDSINHADSPPPTLIAEEPPAKKSLICAKCEDSEKFKREKWEAKKKFYETLTESLQLMNKQIKQSLELTQSGDCDF